MNHSFLAFSCEAGEFLEMSSQQCTSCAAGSYSLGSGVRFDQWDSIPAGFSSLATYMDSGSSGDDSMTCNKSVSAPPTFVLKYSLFFHNRDWLEVTGVCRLKVHHLNTCERAVVCQRNCFQVFALQCFLFQFFMDRSGNSLGVQSWWLHSVSGVRSASHETRLRLLRLSIPGHQHLLWVLCMSYSHTFL